MLILRPSDQRPSVHRATFSALLLARAARARRIWPLGEPERGTVTCTGSARAQGTRPVGALAAKCLLASDPSQAIELTGRRAASSPSAHLHESPQNMRNKQLYDLPRGNRIPKSVACAGSQLSGQDKPIKNQHVSNRIRQSCSSPRKGRSRAPQITLGRCRSSIFHNTCPSA